MSVHESVLHKRHIAINYHAVREAVAADILKVGKKDSQTNLSYLKICERAETLGLMLVYILLNENENENES